LIVPGTLLKTESFRVWKRSTVLATDERDAIQAIKDILHIKDPQAFLQASGYLNDYLEPSLD